jgi:hypothetical protein
MAGRTIARLLPHPATTATPVDTVTATLAWTNGGALAIAFRATGEIESLRIPPRCAPARADGLWRRTCFEVFVMAGDGPAYHELNFSPSGEWAAYAFRRYRDGEPLAVALEPAVVVRQDREALQLDALAPAACLPRAGKGQGLRVGLAAVLEGLDGTLSYWALSHPASRPDFHHPDSRVLAVAWQ